MPESTINDEILKQFMLDNFDYNGLKLAGFWLNNERKNDYKAQADRIVRFFGLKSIYDYVNLPPTKANVFKPLKAVNVFSVN